MTSGQAPGSAFSSARASLETASGAVTYYRLASLADHGYGDVDRLPVTVKLLLENLLRNAGNGVVRDSEIDHLARWRGSGQAESEFPFYPARVLLQDPAIIILDEATASVDPLTEAQIQEGLDLILKNRTSILIAHRLSTIQHADRILVLANGRVVEEGNHEGLLRQGGHYAHLYNTYFRHQSPDYLPGEGFVPVQLPASE